MERFQPNGTVDQLRGRDVYGIFATLFRDGYFHASIGMVSDSQLDEIVSLFGAPWNKAIRVMTVAKTDNPRFIAETEDLIPAHNECAYTEQPPRLLALYCVANSAQDGAFFTVSPGEIINRIEPEYLPSLHSARFSCQMADHVAPFETTLIRQTPIGEQLIFTSVDAMTGTSAYRLLAPVDAYSGDVVAKLSQVVNDPRNRKRHVWQAGDLLVIDNWRLMHGREEFSGGDRVLRHIRIA